MDLKKIKSLYNELKYDAICLDCETSGINKPLTLICFYTPKDGEIEVTTLIQGMNLNRENIEGALSRCKLLITYNGKVSDMKWIEREFPGVIPDTIPHLDLYLIAKELNLNTNLKVLETTLNIDRIDEKTKRRFIAVKLWKRYIEKGDEGALKTLIEYNKQDTINLYTIAEELLNNNSLR